MQEMYDNGLIVKKKNSLLQKYYKSKAEGSKQTITTWWDEGLLTSNASSDLNKMFKENLFNNPKNESLMELIIEISTNENDIVLDYHLGSGTTAAVAHKMNRQYIGIEQMDYIETLAVERLKKVIDGEQGGISKAVNWQGGGEFVYAELAPFNETAKQQILTCENSDNIKTLFEDLCERYFLKYNVSVDEFGQIIQEPEFQSLPLDEQKQMVLEMLDLNQMYVSLSEMDDEQFAGCLNDDDKALSRAFYQAEKKMANNKMLFEWVEDRKSMLEEMEQTYFFALPEFVSNNLKYPFFEWQKSALENFVIFDRTSKLKDFPDIKNRPIHLLFNMATGAGKTMMMAALILYYFEKGYRHFLFFVNQNNIVDKTENNFIDPTHAKFLFTEKILQGNNVIPIRKVETFSQYSDGIEIKFTSIQKLYNDIHIERENQTTLADLHKLNLVMLGDEAHHLNAQTKSKKQGELELEKEMNDRTSNAEIERKGWEHTVLELLLNKKGNPSQNVLLEFTATLPENADVQQKYADKIITKFGLKEFLQKGYTKEINLVSSTLGKKERVLHALLFAWYRHQIALKYSIANFKPVMLFRSKTIDESKTDYLAFLNWVEHVQAADFSFLTTFSTSLNDSDNANEQGKTRTEQALKFMQENGFEFAHLANWVKQNYQKHNVIITNSETNKTKTEKTDSETEKLLNNLEATDNPIRAIFTVDRLTEGWDVLNLFDIVRLYEGQNGGGSNKKSGKTATATVSEKQLIGRGVRYFPFAFEDKQPNKRKFDNDMQHELRILEELFYYTHDEQSRYISELKNELRKDGYLPEKDDDKVLATFKLKSEFTDNKDFRELLIWANKRIPNPNAKSNNAYSLKANP